MNIGIDARPLVEQKTGFGYFLANMLDDILKIDDKNTYYLFSDRDVYYNTDLYSNVVVVRYKDKIYCPKSLYYYFLLGKHIKNIGIKLDVFWGTMHIIPKGLDNNVKKILTIHDFTHLKFPESTTKYNLIISKLFFGTSIANADTIICISKNTKKELTEYYPDECKSKPVKVIYEGGYTLKERNNIIYDENNVSTSILNCKNNKYILFVGTIEPRKNIRVLLEIAPKLKGFVEVIVCGKIGWEKEEVVTALNKTENLRYFKYVTQDEKHYLMKNAFCLVQPSLYEGFGLPVVESMQLGTIAVVANNSSLAELVELDALKFDTNNADDLLSVILELINNKKLYKNAKDYCCQRGKIFDWEKAANEYIKIITGIENEKKI